MAWIKRPWRRFARWVLGDRKPDSFAVVRQRPTYCPTCGGSRALWRYFQITAFTEGILMGLLFVTFLFLAVGGWTP